MKISDGDVLFVPLFTSQSLLIVMCEGVTVPGQATLYERL
jgi:hypothetical protein